MNLTENLNESKYIYVNIMFTYFYFLETLNITMKFTNFY